jgi:antitoxin component YwqK of YwqJK toxin-antitoxin module
VLLCAAAALSAAGCARLRCPSGTTYRFTVYDDGRQRAWCERPSPGPSDLYANGWIPGPTHGPEALWWPEGHYEWLGWYDEGRPIGRHRHYYRNGALRYFAAYGDDGAILRQDEYYENGAWRQGGTLTRSRRHGDWGAAYADGAPRWQGAYYQGRPCGEWRFWPRRGEAFGRRLDRCGPVRAFWTWGEQACPAGSRLSSCAPLGGGYGCARGPETGPVFDGPYVDLQVVAGENVARVTGTLRNDAKAGVWTHYNSQGQAVRTETWADGQRDGLWVEWSDRGDPVAVRWYARDREIRVWPETG